MSDRWLDGDGEKLGIECFNEDMGPKPSPKHSVERIDVNGNYCKENCVWATASEQMRNKRNNRKITAFGETLTMSEWGRKSGLHPMMIQKRLNRGWDPEKAVSLPSGTWLSLHKP